VLWSWLSFPFHKYAKSSPYKQEIKGKSIKNLLGEITKAEEPQPRVKKGGHQLSLSPTPVTEAWVIGILANPNCKKGVDLSTQYDINLNAISSKDRKTMSATAIVNGELIKKLRTDKFITQSQLAEMAGIRAESLCRLEKGRAAKFSTILKLASVLGVEPALLIAK
jgi:DNA-binding XRE family transcriptional regulator